MRSVVAALILSLLMSVSAQAAKPFSPYVDAKGNISIPKDFRTRFVHLGSWAVTDEASSARGFHDVYSERSSVKYYRKTGKFPDAATLVKEIRTLESGAMTTGNPVLWRSSKPAE